MLHINGFPNFDNHNLGGLHGISKNLCNEMDRLESKNLCDSIAKCADLDPGVEVFDVLDTDSDGILNAREMELSTKALWLLQMNVPFQTLMSDGKLVI